MIKNKTQPYLSAALMIISIICTTVSISSCSEEEKTDLIRPVKTVTLTQTKNTIKRQFPAKVIASNEADLAFQVPGIINEMLVQEGDIVKKGQLIARLDQRKYNDAVNETRAKYQQTKADYLRAAQLVEKNYVSRSDYDKKKYEYKVAEANYSTAKNDLEDTYLRVPFDSIIARRYADNFENVKAKQPIVNIHDYETVDLSFNVPENLIIRASDQNNVLIEVQFDSAPGSDYKASLKKFESKADEETQTYRVIATMPNPKDLNVLPGMTATVEIEVPDYSSGSGSFFEVPSTAVFADANDQAFVWLVNPDTMKVKKTPVEISRLSTQEIQILKGVKKGDIIVTAGVHSLQEDEKVRFMEKQKWEDKE